MVTSQSGRAGRLLGEAVRFGAVIAAGTVAALAVFYALVHGPPGPQQGPLESLTVLAYLVANAIGLWITYQGSRSWAFGHREVAGPTGGRVSFLIVNGITLLIPLGCLGISRYVVGAHSDFADGIAAFAVGLPLATAARFWGFKKFVFLHPAKAHKKHKEGANISDDAG